MAHRPEDEKRSIIPRWRPFADTLASGELNLSVPRLKTDSDNYSVHFDVKLREWSEYKSLSFARQLVGAAIVHDRHDEARDAARFILRSGVATIPAMHLAKVVLGGPRRPTPASQVSKLIRQARTKTRILPSSPLPWVDLALGYTMLGKSSEARRAILTAVQYAKNSRFVARSAARFFVHNGELDAAHNVLCRSEAIKYDPWLLASEVAVSFLSDKRPSFVRHARQLIDQGLYHETHLNELLAAIGTLEFQSGSDRRARRLFKRALRNPSENVLAQARWAVQRGLAIEIPPCTIELPKGFETRAWSNLYSGEWSASVENSRNWLEYQQFQSSPALLGSYVSAVALEDHATAIEIIQDGLRANPLNPFLLNNMAYSAASQGDYRRAEWSLKSMSTSGDQVIEVYKAATTGLLRFRQGARELGRVFYSRAAEKAGKIAGGQLLRRLIIFWALEEVRSGALMSESIPERALDLLQSDKDPLTALLVGRIRGAGLSSTR